MNLASRTLPPEVIAPDYQAQLARVRKLGRQALATPGARIAGLTLLVFAPIFARLFLGALTQIDDPEAASPFAYTMR